MLFNNEPLFFIWQPGVVMPFDMLRVTFSLRCHPELVEGTGNLINSTIDCSNGIDILGVI